MRICNGEVGELLHALLGRFKILGLRCQLLSMFSMLFLPSKVFKERLTRTYSLFLITIRSICKYALQGAPLLPKHDLIEADMS